MVVKALDRQSVDVSLTALSSCSGCGAKLAAVDVLPLIRDLPVAGDERLLVGCASGDDAAVYQLDGRLALVQTVDFFTPLVDDPYDFGRIAAANAFSDVYAMGGMPLTALNIVAFPLTRLGGDVLGEILRGGADVARVAGAVVVGGHSIRDDEPKYGLAVTGIVDPSRMVTNAGARAGDVLVLSKPLGVGAIVTAHKRGRASDELLDRAVEVMVALNDDTARVAVGAGVHAMTDVTGFGLLGHLHNMCRASGLSAELDAASIPAIEGVRELLAAGEGISSGTRSNGEWAAGFTEIADTVEPWRARLLSDATTSGGLLAAVSVQDSHLLAGRVIGRLCSGVPGAITVS
jgi:selenide, water dikinase